MSCEAGYAKPDPRVYELALTRLGTTFDKALLVDDMPGHVTAAVAAGLHGHVHAERASTTAAIERFIENLTVLIGSRDGTATLVPESPAAPLEGPEFPDEPAMGVP